MQTLKYLKYISKLMKLNKLKEERKKIALNRIKRLFKLSIDSKDINFSFRYIILARKLSTKYKVSISREYKRLFCKKCNSLLIPSKTCRVRLKGNNIVYTCFFCKEIKRFRFK